jgi:Leucine-rich repeat (LRR) protein
MFSYKEWEALNATDVLYETLKLDHNLLESIDITFPLLKSPLKRIDFSHNKIKQVAVRTFYNLSFIEEIDFSYNQLKFEKFKKSSIFEGKYKATEWEQLEDLKKLDLSHNLLNNLDMNFFEHIEGLKELKLNDNPFQIIHDSCVLAMTGLHNLTRLDMSRMELESIPDNFFLPLDKLEWLDLSGNLLKTIPNGLRTLDNIQDLSLSDNPIKDLNKTEHNFLPPLTTLKRLNLTYMMEMKSIGKETLKGLENLEELHISNNHHLSHIDVDAFKFPEKDNENRSQWPIITKLFLNNNNLSYLDMLTFNNWNKLEEVHIHDNPWECVCELEW